MQQGLPSVNATDYKNKAAIKSYCNNDNNHDCDKDEVRAIHVIVLNNKILRKMVIS